MERFTFKDAGGRWVVPCNKFWHWVENHLPAHICGDAVDRLAAYENTWLEPEEIKRNYEMLTAIAGALKDVSAERLCELAQADREGQCMTLPCRVGDMVWVISAYGLPFDKPKSATVTQFVLHDDEEPFLEAILFMDIGKGEQEYGYSASSFGSLFFSTRKEAETALATQKGAGGND